MSERLPGGAAKIAESHPDVWKAYAALGEACAEAGPLTHRERRLVKLALAVGAASEGAVHSHARRAREEVDPEQLVERARKKRSDGNGRLGRAIGHPSVEGQRARLGESSGGEREKRDVSRNAADRHRT